MLAVRDADRQQFDFAAVRQRMQNGHRAGVIDVAAGIGVEEDSFGRYFGLGEKEGCLSHLVGRIDCLT